MRTMKILAVAAALLVTTASFALACDGNKTSSAKAETASVSGCASSAAAKTADAKTAAAKTADAKTASAGCSSSAAAKTADAKTASAGCSSSASAIKTAGAGCTSGASAIKTAGADCSSKASGASHALKIETVRMPSGALAVFYHGKNAETVAMLQASAEKGDLGCSLAKAAKANDHCKTEMAKTEDGLMILVTSDEAKAIDEVEESYTVAMASMSEGQSE